jgi:hypothetical protein
MRRTLPLRKAISAPLVRDPTPQDDPEPAGSRARAGALLDEPVAGLPVERRGVDRDAAVLAVRSPTHGFATLLLSGNLDREIGERDPAGCFHDLTYFLFA